MKKHFGLLAGIILLLVCFFEPAAADDSEFRLIVSTNSAVVGGDFAVDLETRIAGGNTSPRNLNSLTIDVNYSGGLLAYPAPDTCVTGWALSAGYEASVSKLDGYYRVLVTGNGVPASGAAWSVTTSWQKLATLRWKIATVAGSYTVAMSDVTDAAAYFTATPPSDLAEWNTAPKAPADLKVATKLFLQGPYSAGTHVMNTALRDGSYILLDAPYTDAPRTAVSIPSSISDWVMLQLRSSTTGATVSSKSVLLRSDGQIVADDGTTAEVIIPSIEGEKDYYILARHRNHLGVMSATALALNGISAGSYDFTTGTDKYYGNEAKLLEAGIYGMFAGDANKSLIVNATDYLAIKPNIGFTGYSNADVNMSSIVNATDYLVVKPNIGKTTNIP